MISEQSAKWYVSQLFSEPQIEFELTYLCSQPLPYEVAAIDRSAKRSDPPEPAFAEQEENSSEEGEEVNERSPLNGTSKKNGNGYGT